MKRTLFFFVVLFALSSSLKAQIAIGSTAEPAPFSVLELIGKLRSDTYNGMRLPQIANAAARPQIPAGKETQAAGLMVYNLETNCVDYWNGQRWISQCAPSPVKIHYTYDQAGNRIKRTIKNP